jgi:hypothetical protein
VVVMVHGAECANQAPNVSADAEILAAPGVDDDVTAHGIATPPLPYGVPAAGFREYDGARNSYARTGSSFH